MTSSERVRVAFAFEEPDRVLLASSPSTAAPSGG